MPPRHRTLFLPLILLLAGCSNELPADPDLWPDALTRTLTYRSNETAGECWFEVSVGCVEDGPPPDAPVFLESVEVTVWSEWGASVETVGLTTVGGDYAEISERGDPTGRIPWSNVWEMDWTGTAAEILYGTWEVHLTELGASQADCRRVSQVLMRVKVRYPGAYRGCTASPEDAGTVFACGSPCRPELDAPLELAVPGAEVASMTLSPRGSGSESTGLYVGLPGIGAVIHYTLNDATWAPARTITWSGMDKGFGASLAWLDASRLVVGAPSSDQVLVGTIGEGATPEFMIELGLEPGDPGGGFGTAVAAGDFDGDGATDLAVGAPGLQGGRVFLYRNRTRDPGWDPAQPLFAINPLVLSPGDFEGVLGTPAPGSAFGTALAAGPVWLDFADRDALLIGVPGAGGGAVVQVVLRSTDEDLNGDPEGFAIMERGGVRAPGGSRFGSSLAVGSFDGSFCDRVAVGDAGRVIVLGTAGHGLVQDPVLATLTPDSDAPRFGAALAGGRIDVAPAERLLIAGGSRSLYPTRSGCRGCEAVLGLWKGTDARGKTFRVRVTPSGPDRIRWELETDLGLALGGSDCLRGLAATERAHATQALAEGAFTGSWTVPAGSRSVETQWDCARDVQDITFDLPLRIDSRQGGSVVREALQVRIEATLDGARLELRLSPPPEPASGSLLQSLVTTFVESCLLEPNPIELTRMEPHDCQCDP